MKFNRESITYFTLIFILCAMIYSEGKRNLELQAQIALPVQELFKILSRSQVKMQILDVREKLEDYDDTHIPGSIPLPGCNWQNLPDGVSENVYSYMPTVIVSNNGEVEAFKKCANYFKNARNLQGGITAWVDDNLPEDSGEYFPPKLKAGGGCL